MSVNEQKPKLSEIIQRESALENEQCMKCMSMLKRLVCRFQKIQHQVCSKCHTRTRMLPASIRFDQDQQKIRLATMNVALFRGSNSPHSVVDVLKEANADIVALQEVQAQEEKGMWPLSHVANELRMHYAYAESWAPEYGNAILSKWPFKSTSVKQIHEPSDYRNLLTVVVDIPMFGEIQFCCTHLDHLDEDWRLKQISSILEYTKEQAHVLAGDLNALNRSDYSNERWKQLSKILADERKMPPREDVMNTLLMDKGYRDAASVAASQDFQSTCKHGTRVDYILSSPNFPCQFASSSYQVISSKNTSDHELVYVDIVYG